MDNHSASAQQEPINLSQSNTTQSEDGQRFHHPLSTAVAGLVPSTSQPQLNGQSTGNLPQPIVLLGRIPDTPPKSNLVVGFELGASNFTTAIAQQLKRETIGARQTIWRGSAVWKKKDTSEETEVRCEVLSKVKDGEAEVKGDSWHSRLVMKFIPIGLVGGLGGTHFLDAQMVVFQFQPGEILTSLQAHMQCGQVGYTMLRNGGHNGVSSNPIILIFLYSNAHKGFVGFLPKDQGGFISQFNRVVEKQCVTYSCQGMTMSSSGALIPSNHSPQPQPQGTGGSSTIQPARSSFPIRVRTSSTLQTPPTQQQILPAQLQKSSTQQHPPSAHQQTSSTQHEFAPGQQQSSSSQLQPQISTSILPQATSSAMTLRLRGGPPSQEVAAEFEKLKRVYEQNVEENRVLIERCKQYLSLPTRTAAGVKEACQRTMQHLMMRQHLKRKVQGEMSRLCAGRDDGVPCPGNPDKCPGFQIRGTPSVPPDWNNLIRRADELMVQYLPVELDSKSKEFSVLSSLLEPLQISKIDKILNPVLWRKFLSNRKELMSSKSENTELMHDLGLSDSEIQLRAHVNFNYHNEEQIPIPPYSDNVALLFHGTRSPLVTILTHGLDERVGRNEALLGRGIYFADDPVKSMLYDKHGVLLIYAVYLGDCLSMDGERYHEVRKNSVKEPEKGEREKRNHTDLAFDSITARPKGFNEYVIYNRAQCCPMYAVEYKHCLNPVNTNNTSATSARLRSPPFAWNSKSGDQPPDPPSQPDAPWPFFAQTIFEQIESKSDEGFLIGGGSGFGEISRATQMTSLHELGFLDDNLNRTIMEESNFDLEKAVERLLLGAPTASTVNSAEVGPVPCTSKSLWNNLATSEDTLQAAKRVRLETGTGNPTSTPANVRSTSTNGISTSTNGMSTFTNGMSTFTNGISTSTNGMSTFTNGMSTYTNGMSTFTNGMSTSTNGMSTSTNGMSTSTNGMSTSTNGMSTSTNGMSTSRNAMSTDTVPNGNSRNSKSTSTSGMGSSSSSNAMRPEEAQKVTEECKICADEYEKENSQWSVHPSNNLGLKLTKRSSPTADWKILKCNHKICISCHQKLEETRTTMSGKTHTCAKCPFCKVPDGVEIGTCPDGEMTFTLVTNEHAAGYENFGVLVVRYKIVGLYNLKRVGLFPNTPEGRHVVNLLEVAWDRRLCFKIGTSKTTGMENVLVWNIEHKTVLGGGVEAHGYPDPTYLERILRELAGHGIQ